MDQLTLLLFLALLIVVEEGGCAAHVLPVNDLFVCFRLDLDNQQLLISYTALIHLASVLLKHVIQVPTMETSVEVLLFFVGLPNCFLLLRIFLVVFLVLVALFLSILSLDILLEPLYFLHGLTIIELFTRELDHTAEPFSRKHKLIP